jgi:hypothetical protein
MWRAFARNELPQIQFSNSIIGRHSFAISPRLRASFAFKYPVL